MRICFLTPRFPYPPIKGDSLRVYHQLAALASQHRVTLLSIAETPVGPADLAPVAALCEQVITLPLPRRRAVWNLAGGLAAAEPLQVRYYRVPAIRERLRRLLAEKPFDVVHVTLIRMLPYVWTPPGPPVLVDLIDCLSLNLAGRRSQVRGPARLAYELEYRRVRAYEQAAVRHFPALVVSSPADREALAGPQVTVIPNGVDGARFVFQGPAGRDPATLTFTGNMGYHPNEEAVLWFAAAVWPEIRARYPAARWEIVGTRPARRVLDLARPGNGITVRGHVDDLAGYLARATVAVCPMRSGSGIQNKVLEALATGTPVVATGIANRGVGALAERDLLVADSGPDFSAAVARLLDEPAARARLGQAGRAFIEQHFTWDAHARLLEGLYAGLGRQG